jgi:hypothetical protein
VPGGRAEDAGRLQEVRIKLTDSGNEELAEMSHRPGRESRARGARGLTFVCLIALPLGGCGSMGAMLGGVNSSGGSTPPYVTDAEKAKAQNPCAAPGAPTPGEAAQNKATDCKKSDSR